MKKFTFFLIAALFLTLASGCSAGEEPPQVLATTLPVYDFTSVLCKGTGLKVSQLVNEPVSCLHNYTLQVSQMKKVEAAEVLVINGAGFEGFLHDVLTNHDKMIDASAGIPLDCTEHHHEHDLHSDHAAPEDHHDREEHNDHDIHHQEEEHCETGAAHEHGHHHTHDSHTWMSPKNAKIMVQNISDGLCERYPDHKTTIQKNLQMYLKELDALISYGNEALGALEHPDLITFHNGFHYFAKDFNLNIIKAIEEEPGSETSAHELKELISFVRGHQVPAIFTEVNGSSTSANVIAAETGCIVKPLNMVMYETDYLKAMYQNINTIKEALG